jgi:hypothetical protein
LLSQSPPSVKSAARHPCDFSAGASPARVFAVAANRFLAVAADVSSPRRRLILPLPAVPSPLPGCRPRPPISLATVAAAT